MTIPEKFNKNRSWSAKFRDAAVGVWLGIRGQSSFQVHVAAAIGVVAAAAALRASLVEWCLLVLCITVVMVAEMFNSALEWLAPAIDRQQNEHLAGALDIGSAAVLLASLGASIVGAIIFLYRAGVLLGWWTT